MGAQDNNPVLPGTKVDSHPATTPASQTLAAAEVNAIVTAIADLRAYTLGAAQSEGGAPNWLTLAQNGSPPAAAATKVHLFTDGLRALARVNGDATAHQINPYKVSVTDYGADPTGVADSTSAINAAAAACAALATGFSMTGMSSSGAPTLVFPCGLYNVSNEISVTFNVEGHNAIIVGTDPTKNILNLHPIGNQVYTVRGLALYKGLNQIYKNLNNVNNGVCVIRDCILVNPADAGSCVLFDVADRGTNKVENCFIWTVNSLGSMVNGQGGDQNSVRDCYVSPGKGTAFIAGFAQLTLEHINGAPVAVQSAGGTWISSPNGATVFCRDFRFGGEESLVNVDWGSVSGGGALTIEQCAAFVNPGTPNFKFHRAPGVLKVDLLDGQGSGVWFDPAMAAADKRAIARGLYRIGGAGERSPLDTSYPTLDYSGDAYCTQAAMNDALMQSASDLVQNSDFVVAIPDQSLAFGNNGSDNNVSTALVTNIFGMEATKKTGLAGGGSAGRNWSLPWLPAGLYTAAVDIDCDAPCGVQMFFGDAQKSFVVCPGDPSLRVYFSIDPAVTQHFYANISVGVKAGQSATINRIRIFQGRKLIASRRTVLFGTAVPTQGHFQKCDEVVNPSPAAGGSPGWVCTSIGAAFSAAWAQSTGYTVGQHIQSGNGSVYVCSHAGTSSNMGTGPTGTGGGIVDGTCHWEFLDSALAVFKARAPLAP